MNAITLFFAVLGAAYISWLLMKFIVWIDGVDKLECEEEGCEETLSAAPVERRSAA